MEHPCVPFLPIEATPLALLPTPEEEMQEQLALGDILADEHNIGFDTERRYSTKYERMALRMTESCTIEEISIVELSAGNGDGDDFSSPSTAFVDTLEDPISYGSPFEVGLSLICPYCLSNEWQDDHCFPTFPWGHRNAPMWDCSKCVLKAHLVASLKSAGDSVTTKRDDPVVAKTIECPVGVATGPDAEDNGIGSFEVQNQFRHVRMADYQSFQGEKNAESGATSRMETQDQAPSIVHSESHPNSEESVGMSESTFAIQLACITRNCPQMVSPTEQTVSHSGQRPVIPPVNAPLSQIYFPNCFSGVQKENISNVKMFGKIYSPNQSQHPITVGPPSNREPTAGTQDKEHFLSYNSSNKLSKSTPIANHENQNPMNVSWNYYSCCETTPSYEVCESEALYASQQLDRQLRNAQHKCHEGVRSGVLNDSCGDKAAWNLNTQWRTPTPESFLSSNVTLKKNAAPPVLPLATRSSAETRYEESNHGTINESKRRKRGAASGNLPSRLSDAGSTVTSTTSKRTQHNNSLWLIRGVGQEKQEPASRSRGGSGTEETGPAQRYLTAYPVRARHGVRNLPLLSPFLLSAEPDVSSSNAAKLIYDRSTREWRIFWKDGREARYKVFQCKKYGKDRAYGLAVDYARQIGRSVMRSQWNGEGLQATATHARVAA